MIHKPNGVVWRLKKGLLTQLAKLFCIVQLRLAVWKLLVDIRNTFWADSVLKSYRKE